MSDRGAAPDGAPIAPIALIGLDWGSSNLRAFAFDASGQVMATRRSADGALTLSGEDAFNAALTAMVGDWAAAAPKAPLVACGMVGARTGWREAPYVSLSPGSDGGRAAVDAAVLARAVLRVDTALYRPLIIIPGVASSEPDVMRGEETLLVGADVAAGVIVLPGTHSKWVQMADGGVARFATFFTGEMNALIREHSAVGKALLTAKGAAPPDLLDGPAFDQGIQAAKTGASRWLHDLFVMRASVVTARQSAQQVSTALSGWLLGCEFVAALEMFPGSDTFVLIASANLVPWYQRAAAAFGVHCTTLDADQLAARGIWRIAHRLT